MGHGVSPEKRGGSHYLVRKFLQVFDISRGKEPFFFQKVPQ